MMKNFLIVLLLLGDVCCAAVVFDFDTNPKYPDVASRFLQEVRSIAERQHEEGDCELTRPIVQSFFLKENTEFQKYLAVEEDGSNYQERKRRRMPVFVEFSRFDYGVRRAIKALGKNMTDDKEGRILSRSSTFWILGTYPRQYDLIQCKELIERGQSIVRGPLKEGSTEEDFVKTPEMEAIMSAITEDMLAIFDCKLILSNPKWLLYTQ